MQTSRNAEESTGLEDALPVNKTGFKGGLGAGTPGAMPSAAGGVVMGGAGGGLNKIMSKINDASGVGGGKSKRRKMSKKNKMKKNKKSKKNMKMKKVKRGKKSSKNKSR